MSKWIFILGLMISCSVSAQQVETIVFMRHGEKPNLGLGQLNCRGLNRSLLLARILNTKFGSPDYIFAPNPYSSLEQRAEGVYFYVRALATIEPTAIYFTKAVNTDYSYVSIKKVAHELTSSKYHNSLLFVAWEHKSIELIAKRIMKMLGVDPHRIPPWPKDDFDSLYIFKINWGYLRPEVTFIHDYEYLNNQSPDCPTPELLTPPPVPLESKTFIFIPEAELNGCIDQLSCQGLNRALALPLRLKNRYPTIDAFIIPKAELHNGEFRYIASLMTIEPSIIHYHYPSLFFANAQDIFAMTNYLTRSDSTNQTQAIAWPKDDMANLAQSVYRAYGGNPNEIPNPVPSNDIIYEIVAQGDKGERNVKFTQIQENLNDRSTFCP